MIINKVQFVWSRLCFAFVIAESRENIKRLNFQKSIFLGLEKTNTYSTHSLTHVETQNHDVYIIYIYTIYIYKVYVHTTYINIYTL